jgi:hypothetical protein
MKCQEVLKQLSPFIDAALEPDIEASISAHLQACTGCRKELARLKTIQAKLRSLENLETPEYLRHLVLLRAAQATRDTWFAAVRDASEYRWSKIRTVEGLWFVTRILGTAMACVFFFTLSSAVNPSYLDVRPQLPDNPGFSQDLRQQLGPNVLKRLGLLPLEAQKKPIIHSEAMINDLYFLNFGQYATRAVEDDSFSVVTMVDSRGEATIQNVLEYPADESLLTDFNRMLVSARCRAASENGRAVNSRLVMTFSRISVYD